MDFLVQKLRVCDSNIARGLRYRKFCLFIQIPVVEYTGSYTGATWYGNPNMSWLCLSCFGVPLEVRCMFWMIDFVDDQLQSDWLWDRSGGITKQYLW